MPMRSELVDSYFQQVMRETGGAQSQVFQQIYMNVMDNRIFNNLKQQLNEMIEDEKSLISIEEFRKMFFMFFKGEFKANVLFDQLLPFITVTNIGDNVYESSEAVASRDRVAESEEMVSIQKLTKFIDAFNFSPVRVNKIHMKNDSHEMTYVMTSNTKGNLARSEDPLKLWQNKSDDEKRLLKLLSLVSHKIHERFRNLRQAFRYIDTDHSQSISINEFAQAIDFFRLKISFEDIERLFRYMDSDGNGTIGYKEFTLLDEENWRVIDPFEHWQKGVKNRGNFHNSDGSMRQTQTESGPAVEDHTSLGTKATDIDGLYRLEHLSKDHMKLPFRRPEKEATFQNITRSDPASYLG